MAIEGATNGQKLNINPEITELLGHEKLVYFTFQNEQIVASIPPEIEACEGIPLILSLQLEKVSYFDPQTEKNILYS
jgi:hypothetical protein